METSLAFAMLGERHIERDLLQDPRPRIPRGMARGPPAPDARHLQLGRAQQRRRHEQRGRRSHHLRSRDGTSAEAPGTLARGVPPAPVSYFSGTLFGSRKAETVIKKLSK